MINQNLLLAGEDAYNLTNSLRFRSSASAYLNRTPASTTNRQKWTLSGWVKRGVSQASIFSTNASDNSSYGYIGFDSDAFRIYQWNGSSYDFQLITTPVYRDYSSWYHFVISVDTTQATAANRIRFYVNGVEVTTFSTNTTPSQNLNTYLNNSSYSHLICRNPAGSSTYFDGYLSEVNFIDGQALTPSLFGETSTTTGVWIPKKYAGTYGTNGFYLPFTDNSALTTSSNVGLGRDYSGNGNYWTTNNISITAGITYDSMTDVPTLTSATASNFAVMNPLDQIALNSVTNANLTTTTNGSVASNIRGTFAVSSGKWYWEVTCGAFSTAGTWMIGIADATTPIASSQWSTVNGWAYYGANGEKYNSGSSSAYGATYTTNDIIGVALDMDNGTLTFYKNGTSQGTAFNTGLAGKTISPMTGSGLYTVTANFNFGQRPFAYTPPTGFVRLNTFNLPTPTIGASASTLANKYFDVKTRTGADGATAVSGINFQPDFVWVKGRNVAVDHALFDAVRGTAKTLYSSSTSAEVATDTFGYLSAFNSNGYSFTAGGSGIARVDNSSYTYVDWVWKANGAAVTNTAGSISAQVSANTSAGFSVVTYTGTGVTGTIGHGLGVAPAMIIVKSRSNSSNWYAYHQSIGNTGAVGLNLTSATITSANFWNNTSPTSSVFTASAGSAEINGNGLTYVAYCFSQIAGYSAFGSYTGNGSADGGFIYTGFRPRYIMWKRSDSTGDWIIFDTARDTFNYADKQLVANSSGAEAVTGGGFVRMDFLSNGFKIRSTDSYINANGGTYIYACFAESPFKFSNAR
jgi:hypothetical protein